MKAAILKCKAGSRFHFGRYAPDADTALNESSEIMHSDTLFSALVTTYNDIYSDTDDFVNCFTRGEIHISSLFFCLEQGEEFVWFLPKPVSFDLVNTDDHKSFKRIRYISKKLWEQLSSPQELLDLINREEKKVVILDNAFAMMRNEIQLKSDSEITWKRMRLYESVNLPKVQVREQKNEGNLYQLNLIEIADNSERAVGLNIHYYFLYELSNNLDEKFVARFKQTLEVLAESGIGAERSTIGHLEGIVTDETQWSDPAGDSEYHCTLSLLSPQPSDFANLKYYHSILRGGRAIGRQERVMANGEQIINQMHLKSVRMISEGAIANGKVKGMVHTIDPENPKKEPLPKFRRCGTALSLPIKKLWEI